MTCLFDEGAWGTVPVNEWNGPGATRVGRLSPSSIRIQFFSLHWEVKQISIFSLFVLFGEI